MSMATLRCFKCGAEFTRKPSAVVHPERSFCSRACAFRPLVARSCEWCGAGFQVTEYRVAHGFGRYCSRACSFSGRKSETHSFARIAPRFWPKVNRDGPIPAHCPELGPCHIWTGAHEPGGRGQLRIGRRSEYAARVAFLLHYGRWPEPCCLHKCDGGNIGCVRWDHLFEGTKADNTADMMRKGRHRFGRPPRSKRGSVA